jgi:hypothetical protein
MLASRHNCLEYLNKRIAWQRRWENRERQQGWLNKEWYPEVVTPLQTSPAPEGWVGQLAKVRSEINYVESRLISHLSKKRFPKGMY